jgi:DNA-binding CsgD family transcriptional regulator
MIGTTDDRLLIDRVGTDAEPFLGYPPKELLGRSILSLVDDSSVAHMLGALAHAFTATRAVATAAGAVRTKGGQMLRCEAVVVPLVPPPTSAFALFPAEPDVAKTLTDVQRLLQRFSDRIAAIDLTTALATAPSGAEVPGVTRLTTRELQIVRRLVGGDRVPAIADALFLSQNTVRNQLSSVYRKLGVRSQQEVVDLFRVTVSHEPTGPTSSK